MSDPTRIRPPRGILYEARRSIALWLLRCAGWVVEGAAPVEDKCVVIAAPHTSNWDLPLMLGVAYTYRIRLQWMGKASLFSWPFGWFMRALGGIAIDRSKANDVVTQMVEVFDKAEALAVAIPPEGTRSKVRAWKTGFYNIAHGAGVPIVLGFLDYKRKVGGIGGVMKTTGEYAIDIEEIKTFYASVSGRYDDKYNDT